jgi:hypothetical protein
MWQFKNLAMTLTNQNCLHGRNEKQVKSGQCLLPFSPESSVFISYLIM